VFDKKLREDFTKGLTEGIKVPLMNESNIDEFFEGIELFFQEAQNDYWLNRLDTGIYSLEYGSGEELFLLLITPGLIQFRVKYDFSEIPKSLYHNMAGGALGVFTFVNLYNGDIEFEVFDKEKEESKKPVNIDSYLKTKTKKIRHDDGEVWILKNV